MTLECDCTLNDAKADLSDTNCIWAEPGEPCTCLCHIVARLKAQLALVDARIDQRFRDALGHDDDGA